MTQRTPLTQLSLPQSVKSQIRNADERISGVIRRYRGTRVGTALLLVPGLLVVFALLVIPALILIRYSFFPFDAGRIQPGITLENYRRVFRIPLYVSITIRTIRISIVVTILAFLIGFPLAYAAVRTGGRLGRVIVLATFAPLTIDLVIRSFGWFVLLGNDGVIRTSLGWTIFAFAEEPPQLIHTEVAIILGMTHVILPFMVFPIINVLHTIPVELEEAARDLGASRLGAIRHVVLPLAMPGIVAGMLMAFLLTMAAYVTPAILGGTIEVLPTLLTNLITTSRNWPFAGALSMILLVVAVVVIVGYHQVRGHIGADSRV